MGDPLDCLSGEFLYVLDTPPARGRGTNSTRGTARGRREPLNSRMGTTSLEQCELPDNGVRRALVHLGQLLELLNDDGPPGCIEQPLRDRLA